MRERPGPSREVREAATLVEILTHRATSTPDVLSMTYLSSGGPLTVTYGQLRERACRAAARFRAHAEPGARVVLLYGSGLDFVYAFLGCHVAGLIPVPVMPPREMTEAELARVRSILEDVEPAVVATIAPLAEAGAAFFGGTPIAWVTLDELHRTEPIAPVGSSLPGALALIQYTSGSTSSPRGVMVSHDNLLHNLGYIYWGERNDASTVSVSWLPMSHDMGLIEGVLQPLYGGYPVVLMSPMAFMKQPLRWLEAIAQHRATVSGGPNFAYDLVLRRLGEGPLPPLDLSHWRFAYNGSEPVRAETIEAFTQKLAPLGFRPEAMQPLYGMAEATLGITAGRFGQSPRFQRRVTAWGERTLVSCGVTPDDLEVAIVSPGKDRRAGPGEEGEIWLAGPCIAEGYWRRPEETERVFGATLDGETKRYLRTGDLGFVLDREVFISGRIKDLIVSRGQNVHPPDLERTAEAAHPWLRPGGAAAFRIDGEEESAGLVCELSREGLGATPAELVLVAHAVRRAVVRAHGLPVSPVLLVEPGALPRTTSGKLQRARVSEMWRAGLFTVRARAVDQGGGEGFSEWLLTRTANLLGLEPSALNRAATLPELGLDSVRALELYGEAAARLGGLSLAAFLGTSLDDLLRSSGAVQAVACPVELPPDFVVAPPREGMGALLLTGATGFLGGHVLVELLSSSDAHVVCLVRGSAGLARLVAGLPRWQPEWAERVTVLEGDVASPLLGLSEAAHRALAARIEAVFHCAALVNWAYPYAALAPTNVGGTLHCLALAAQAGARFVYVSTMACCWSQTAGRVDEDTDPRAHQDGIYLDYVRTKAVAEGMVRDAGARGLRVSIVRPGLVFSHTETGRHSAGDFLSSLCKGCIEMGAAPDLDWALDICPVDEAAAAIARVPVGECVHLEAQDRRPWRAVVLWMALRGHPMRLLSYDAWCEALLRQTEAKGATLRALRAFFTRPVVGALRLPELYEEPRRNPISSVRSLAMVGPRQPLDAALLERTFTFLTASGYLPAPETNVAPVEHPAARIELLKSSLSLDGATPLSTGESQHSIIGELASWRYGCAAGVRRLRLHHAGEGLHPRAETVVLKAFVPDSAALEIGAVLATLCSEALGVAWNQHRSQSEILRGGLREAALYRCGDPRFVSHTPALLGAAPGALLLEDLTGTPLLDAVDEWDESAIHSAIRGIAQIHAIWLGNPPEADWLPPRRDVASLEAQASLWSALADFALSRSFGRALGSQGRERYATLRSDITAWASLSTRLPQTLIHNDFSPRNAALRPDGRLCVYDWELARVGLPQRDLAEFLCFTAPAGIGAEGLGALLELHRSALVEASGVALDPTAWRAGFAAALAELLVTRLPMYAMVDAFRPQPFLERVVSTWATLDRLVRDV